MMVLNSNNVTTGFCRGNKNKKTTQNVYGRLRIATTSLETLNRRSSSVDMAKRFGKIVP